MLTGVFFLSRLVLGFNFDFDQNDYTLTFINYPLKLFLHILDELVEFFFSHLSPPFSLEWIKRLKPVTLTGFPCRFFNPVLVAFLFQLSRSF